MTDGVSSGHSLFVCMPSRPPKSHSLIKAQGQKRPPKKKKKKKSPRRPLKLLDVPVENLSPVS